MPIAHYWLSICLIVISSSESRGQCSFQSKVDKLKHELGFKEYESHGSSPNPVSQLQSRFQHCSKYYPSLQDLSFEYITHSQVIELRSPTHGHRMSLFQWTMVSQKEATTFLQVLSSIEHRRLQECVNKGGIAWWGEGNCLYIITSPAYNMTFSYGAILNALKD